MLSGILIILVLIIALLAIPISLGFNINRPLKFHNQLTLGWMFGLVSFHLPLTKKRFNFSDNKEPQIKPRLTKQSAKKDARTHFFFDHQLRQRIMKFIRDVWRSINKEKIDVKLTAGLGDPADTGQLWAIVGPIAGYLASIRQYSIEVQPNFANAGLEFEGRGNIRFSPLRIIILSIGFLFSPLILRTLLK